MSSIHKSLHLYKAKTLHLFPLQIFIIQLVYSSSTAGGASPEIRATLTALFLFVFGSISISNLTGSSSTNVPWKESPVSCTYTSVPSSCTMKPNLRSALNHLTFPVVVVSTVKRADDLDEDRSGDDGAKATADENVRVEITE